CCPLLNLQIFGNAKVRYLGIREAEGITSDCIDTERSTRTVHATCAAKAGAGSCAAGAQAERKSGLELIDWRNLPAIQEVGRPSFMLPGRFDNAANHEALPNVID